MPLSKRDTKFFLRLCVLLFSALTLGLAVRAVFATNEIDKMIPQSLARDILLFAAPITSLAVLHYTLAVKSFGIRGARIEVSAFAGFAMIFAAIVAPVVIGVENSVPPTDCPWYRRCPDDVTWVPNLYIAFTFAGIGVALLLAVLWSQLGPRPSHPPLPDDA